MSSPDSAAAGPLPPVYSPHSKGKSPERAIMLQRYMALTSQQGSVRRRLSISSASSSSSSSSSSTSSSASSSSSPPASPTSLTPHSSPEMSSTSSEASSTSSSPTLHGQRGSFSQIPPPVYALPKPAHSSSSRKMSTQHQSTMSSIPEDESLTSDDFTISRNSSSSSQDEDQLFNINYDIKSTLTDLLNCEAVRNDPKMRVWVQSRLMDAELELKRQRKRRVSAPSIVVSPSEDLDRRASVA